jgi:hypothetical protein
MHDEPAQVLPNRERGAFKKWTTSGRLFEHDQAFPSGLTGSARSISPNFLNIDAAIPSFLQDEVPSALSMIVFEPPPPSTSAAPFQPVKLKTSAPEPRFLDAGGGNIIKADRDRVARQAERSRALLDDGIDPRPAVHAVAAPCADERIVAAVAINSATASR